MLSLTKKGRDVMKQLEVFPGSRRLVEGVIPPASLFLMGPSGIGKTIFSKQFIYNGLANGETGIYLSTDESPGRIQESMKKLGMNIDTYIDNDTFRIIDCYSWKIGGKSCSKYCVSNPDNLATVSMAIDKARRQLRKTRLVLDSITGLMSFCNHNLTFFSKFLQVIVAQTRDSESNAIFLASSETHDRVFISYMREIFDGTLEMKMETKTSESGEEIKRLMRLFSLKGAKHKTQWAVFEITNNGVILKSEKEIRCVMCSGRIDWEPHLEIIEGKQYSFDSDECATTYKKLKALYGSSFE
jgi:KaiC/GvpD/RAD55 family RecA-like ATPase